MNLELEEFLQECKDLKFEKIYHKTYKIKSDGQISKESLSEYERKYEIISKEPTERGWHINYIKEEQEFIFFNYEYSALLQFDTYNQSGINSTELSMNIEVSDNNENIMGMDVSPLHYTNIKGVRAKMFGSLKSALFNILSYGKPLKYWYEEMGSTFYSYLTHQDVEVGEEDKWEKLAQDKIDCFPEEVKNRIYGNLIHDLRRVKFSNKNDYTEYKNFYEKLSYEEKVISYLRNAILDRFSFEDFMHQRILEKAKKENLKKEILKVTCSLYKDIVYSDVEKRYEDIETKFVLKAISECSFEELEIIKNKTYYLDKDFFITVKKIANEELLKRKVKIF